MSIFATESYTCRYAIIPTRSTDNWDGFLVRWGPQTLPASQISTKSQFKDCQITPSGYWKLWTQIWSHEPYKSGFPTWKSSYEIIMFIIIFFWGSSYGTWGKNQRYFYLQLEQISDNHEFGEDDRLKKYIYIYICENYNCVTQIHMPVVIFPHIFLVFVGWSFKTNKKPTKKMETSKIAELFVWMAKIWAPIFFGLAVPPQEKQDRIRHYAEILVPVKVTGRCEASWTNLQEMPTLGWNHSYMGVSTNNGTPKWMVKIRENPIKMGWFGGPTLIFGKTPIYIYTQGGSIFFAGWLHPRATDSKPAIHV